MASNLLAMASNLLEMAINLLEMASNLIAMGINLLEMASNALWKFGRLSLRKPNIEGFFREDENSPLRRTLICVPLVPVIHLVANLVARSPKLAIYCSKLCLISKRPL